MKCQNAIKEKASITSDKPCQIIQDVVSQLDPSVVPYVGSKETISKMIRRVRKEGPQEPSDLQDMFIPDEYRKTFSGETFLVSESNIGDDKILLFTTHSNVKKLKDAHFWIMDGTFKTVPTLFKQLYTIHAPVGPQERSRILPLVYVLMTRKNTECYVQVFRDLLDYAAESDINLSPEIIITDFEIGVISAIGSEIPGTQHKGCFFHLGQSIYRKVISSGLRTEYGTNENLSLKIRQMAALAFLPPNEIKDAWLQLKQTIPDEATHVVNYFDENYVRGKVRRMLRGQEVRNPPLFPPALWSVYDRVEASVPRTQNKVEAWHRRLEVLLGSAHVGLFKLINELRKEQKNMEDVMECIVSGEIRLKLKIKDAEREQRILTVFSERENYEILDFLRALAHNLRF